MTKTIRFVTCVALSCIVVNVAATAICAAPKATSSTRSAAQREIKPATYEQLRRSLKIDENLTLENVQSDPQTYGGRVIEFVGNVTGVMKKSDVRNVIINVENSLVTFALPSDFRDAAVLGAGNRVRVLALVGRVSTSDNASQTLPLSPLAAQIASAETVTQAANAPLISSDTTIALDKLPAATELPIAKGTRRVPANNAATLRNQSSTRSNTIQKRSTITIDNGEDANDAQMPAYRVMIQRHNSKLRPDQVDAIALALLQAGAENKMDPRFLAAVIAVESDFDIYCRSSSGAMGLGQIMPFNLKEARITNAWDPVQNVFGTARLLRGHLNDYIGRANATLLAVAAYNAGPGAVRRAGYIVPKGAQVQRYVWKVYYRYKSFAPDMF